MGSVSPEGARYRRTQTASVLTPSEHQFYRQRSSCATWHCASSGTPARGRAVGVARPFRALALRFVPFPRASPWAIEARPFGAARGAASDLLFCRP